MKIPFYSNAYQEERFGPEIRQALDRVIAKGHFILGDEVRRFEQTLAEFCGVKHAIGVANGSDAIYLGVRACHLPKNGEVLTTPYTFFASASSLVRHNLRPVFVDIDPTTYHIDIQQLESKLSKDTVAVLSVDLFSHTANNSELVRFSAEHNLKFIEDSAEAFGMKWNGKHAGTESAFGVLSFFPTKTLGCFGDGGAIVTNDDIVAEECRIGRTHGAAKKYHHSFVGINSRLDEIQAAVLNVKFKYVEDEIRLRQSIVEKYCEGLQGIEQVKLPVIPALADPVWYVFSPAFENRDKLVSSLQEKGIGTFVYWPKPLHLQECFASLGYRYGDFPNSEKLCESTLALPVFPGMSDDQICYVIDSIRSFYKKS
jgi:dTDP-4-amino-4,6-dideoxygalactose transaminase